MTEIESRWVLGYEGHYFVTTEGDIFSVKKYRGGEEPRQLNPTTNSSGYLKVSLSLDGVISDCLVHIAILEAFVGPRPSGLQGLHRDDDKMNNYVSNLYWGTYVQNTNDASANRRTPTGSNHWRSRFTEDEISQIREEYKSSTWLDGTKKNVSHGSLARKYGVAESTIRNIIIGQTYREPPETAI